MATTDLERFVNQKGRETAIREVRRQIDAEGVEYMYYQFISVTGRVMGKGIPAAHWERIAQSGFQLVYGSTANLFVDRDGNYIGYGPEARELVGIAEPETFCVLPWDRKTARVFCTLFRGREEEVDEAAIRVYNLLTAMTMELQMLARACGKTDVHSLEPEDLCALTVEASAMAKVPLAGTNYIPGVTEEKTLGEIKGMLEKYLADQGMGS